MAQADRGEFFRVQPDSTPPPNSEEGIHSWPFGSYAPMGFYRPAPIVHFTGTVVVQFLLSFLLVGALTEFPGIFVVGTCAILALILVRRASTRWMPLASTAWKVATFVAVALNLLFFSFVAVARGCGADRLATALEQAAIDRSTTGEGCRPSLSELLGPDGETWP